MEKPLLTTKSALKMLGFLLILGAGFVACSKGGSGGEAPAPVNPGVGQIPPPQCPNNQTWYGGVCIDPGQLPLVNGAFAFYSENYYKKNLRVSSSGTLRSFLKEAMGVCDQATYTGGMLDCNSWTGGGVDFVIQGGATENTLRAIITTWPKFNYGFQYGYQLPSIGDALLGFFGFPIITSYGAYRNPLILDMVISPINNSQGFEARSYGDFYTHANRSLMQLQVFNGRLQDGYFDFQFAYQPVKSSAAKVMFQGQFIRCKNPSCAWGY